MSSAAVRSSDVPQGAATPHDGVPPAPEYVEFHAGGRAGRRLVRNPGDAGYEKTFEDIPVIDFTDAFTRDPQKRFALAQKLAAVAERVGFFQAANTPISEGLITDTLNAYQRFFAEPYENKYAVSWYRTPGSRGYEDFASPGLGRMHSAGTAVRESFLMGDDYTEPEQAVHNPPVASKPQNIWPEHMPEFREQIYKYYNAVIPLAREILQLLALGLGLEEDAFDAYHKHPTTVLRCNHYPPQDSSEEVPGFAAHADFSTITLVLQRKEHGSALQALNKNGHWIPVDPIGTFACNIGDFLQQLTGGRFLSTVHRVINSSGVDRYSIPLFFSPDPSAILRPLVKPVTDNPLYQPELYNDEQTVGDFVFYRTFYSRRFHPMMKKIRRLKLPESEWKFAFLQGAMEYTLDEKSGEEDEGS